MDGILKALNIESYFRETNIKLENIVNLSNGELELRYNLPFEKCVLLKSRCRSYINNGDCQDIKEKRKSILHQDGKWKRDRPKPKAVSLKFSVVPFTDIRKAITDPALKTKIEKAGLGDETIYFNDKHMSPDMFRETIEETYCKLKNIGGFEFLRSTGKGSELIELKPPDNWWSPDSLQRRFRGVYHIRPIQKNVSLDPQILVPTESQHKVECTKCHVMVPYVLLKDHVKRCHNRFNESESEDDLEEGFSADDLPFQTHKTFEENLPPKRARLEELNLSSDRHGQLGPSTSKGQGTRNSFIAELVGDGGIGDDAELFEIELAEATRLSLIEYNQPLQRGEACPNMDEAIQALEFWRSDVRAGAPNPIKQKILVSRLDVLVGFTRASLKPNFDWKSEIKIEFTGEIGSDAGGLKREFRRLMFESIVKKVFVGSERVQFQMDYSKITNGQYAFMGKAFAWLLYQGLPYPRCFHPSVYRLLSGQDIGEPDIELGEIKDERLDSLARQVEAAQEDFSADLRDSISEFYPRSFTAKLNEKEVILKCLKRFYIERTLPAVAQFRRGLNEMAGLGHRIEKSANVFEFILSAQHRQPLTRGDILGLFKIKYTEDGVANYAALERKTMDSFELFLDDLENEKGELNRVLSFITGDADIPAEGYGKKIDVNFYERWGEGQAKIPPGRLPYANTCAPSVSLPRGVEVEDMVDMMTRALSEGSVGFFIV